MSNGKKLIVSFWFIAILTGCKTPNEREIPPATSAAGESTPVGTLATSQSMAASLSEDALARFLSFQQDLAPLVHRAAKIARDPSLGGDTARIAQAMSADMELQHLDRVTRRALRRYNLSREDLSSAAALISDAQFVLDSEAKSANGETEFSQKHGVPATQRVKKQHAQLLDLTRGLDPKTERKIDCDRQPDSCSCTPCPSGPCEVSPSYTNCMNGCSVAFGVCIVSAIEFPPAMLACAAAYTICSLNCGAPTCQ